MIQSEEVGHQSGPSGAPVLFSKFAHKGLIGAGDLGKGLDVLGLEGGMIGWLTGRASEGEGEGEE